MNTQLFIRRPITTTLIMVAILVFGIFAYRLLPVSDLPNVDFPTIQVNAALPGASPETMASAVALPLEKQFSTIAGLDSMTSSSALGSSSITLQFTLDRNIDAAAQDVQAMIAKTLSQLPPEMPSPPSYQKVNPADQPIIYLSLNSPTMKLSDVDEYAETNVAQRISMVSGVAQVQVFGAQKYAVRAQLDPRKLAIHQIGLDEVESAITNANVNLPTGTLYGHSTAYTVQATGQLLNAAQYRPLIVAYRNGSPVRLDEVGHVYDSVENDKTATWFSGRRGIVLPIFRQPGTNTVEVVDNIRKLFPTLRAQMPAAVNLDVLYDRSISITLSLAAVFIPVLFMGGIVGRLLHEFAVTIGVSILVSGFVSLTLTPMLCSRFLKPAHNQQHGRLYQKSEAVFQGMLRFYDWSLKKVMAHSFATLMLSFVILGATVYLYILIPKGFMPNEDQGQIF